MPSSAQQDSPPLPQYSSDRTSSRPSTFNETFEKMTSMSLGTARYLCPAIYLLNTGVQIWGGKYHNPSMLDIHNKHYGIFSPYAMAVPVFFGAQSIFQIWWLTRLWTSKNPLEIDTALRYAPVYSIGNLAIAVWLFFWVNDAMDSALASVTLNSSLSLYILTQLQPKTRDNVLTHIVSNMTAAIGCMDFVHSYYAVHGPREPTLLIKAGTAIITLGLSYLGDPVLGGGIAYCLGALAAGQSGSWQTILGVTSAANGLLALFKTQQQ